jgi:hypothetical protein
MPIQVLVEPLANNGFRASSGEPIAASVEAPTRQEALAKLKQQIQARLKNGAELVPLEVEPAPHPLAEFVGMFKDDPLLESWKQSMAEYRRKIDQHPELP